MSFGQRGISSPCLHDFKLSIKTNHMNHHPTPKHYTSLAPTNFGTTPILQQTSQSAIAKVKGKFINLNLFNPKPSQMSSQDTHIGFYKS